MLPADPAARAGSTPEASGDSSSGTFGKEMAMSLVMTVLAISSFYFYIVWAVILPFCKSANVWIRLFPICTVVAGFVATMIPTPGAWSDLHSQWLPSLLLAMIALLILIVSIGLALRRRLLVERIAGISGILFSLVALPALVAALYSSILFFEQVREAQSTWTQ